MRYKQYIQIQKITCNTYNTCDTNNTYQYKSIHSIQGTTCNTCNTYHTNNTHQYKPIHLIHAIHAIHSIHTYTNEYMRYKSIQSFYQYWHNTSIYIRIHIDTCPIHTNARIQTNTENCVWIQTNLYCVCIGAPIQFWNFNTDNTNMKVLWCPVWLVFCEPMISSDWNHCFRISVTVKILHSLQFFIYGWNYARWKAKIAVHFVIFWKKPIKTSCWMYSTFGRSCTGAA